MRNLYKMYFITVACMFCMVACNTNGSPEEDSDTIKDYSSETQPSETVSTCYESIQKNDTVFLSLFSESDVITGSLMYNYYEKDRNSGTLRGYMYGDTLIADYIFMSEGQTSERQVAFLKKDSSFIEGYGDVEEQDGKIVFKNTNTLNFTGTPLYQVSCNRK